MPSEILKSEQTKPEIDWTKPGQYVIAKGGIIVCTDGKQNEPMGTFGGFVIHLPPQLHSAPYSENWLKSEFTFLAEPVTLKIWNS